MRRIILIICLVFFGFAFSGTVSVQIGIKAEVTSSSEEKNNKTKEEKPAKEEKEKLPKKK